MQVNYRLVNVFIGSLSIWMAACTSTSSPPPDIKKNQSTKTTKSTTVVKPNQSSQTSQSRNSTKKVTQSFLFGQFQQAASGRYQLVYENVTTRQLFGVFFTSKAEITTVVVEPGVYRLKAWHVLTPDNRILGSKSAAELAAEANSGQHGFPFANEFTVSLGKAYYLGKFKVVEATQQNQLVGKLEYTLKYHEEAFNLFRKTYQSLQQVDTVLAYSK